MKSLFLIIVLVMLMATAFSQNISAGMARIDITPEGPIRMSGHKRKLGSDTLTPISHAKATNRLFAKALAMGNDPSEMSVLITVDLVGIPVHITKEVAARLNKKKNIDPSHVTISASHTHHGPEVGNLLSLTMIFADPPVTGEELAQIAMYVQELTDKLEAVALNAIESKKPALLSWGQGTVGFARNRRMIKEGLYVAQKVNPDGNTDHSLPLLKITDPAGKLIGVFLNYACHCTTVPGNVRNMHGDWNGEAQRLIEANHPEAIAMIASGCGADQMPDTAGSTEVAEMHGKEIANEVERLLSKPLQPLSGTPSVQYKQIELPFEHIPTINELSQQIKEKGERAFNAYIFLEKIVRGVSIPKSIQYPVQSWVFGNELAIIFLGGEAVVDYSLRLKKELGTDRIWVNAYSNDIQCYVPTKKLLREGGYEVLGHLPFYNQPSRLSEDVEDIIIHTVHDILPEQFKAVKPVPKTIKETRRK